MDHFTLRLDSLQRLNDLLGRLEDVTNRDGGHLARDPEGDAFEFCACDP